MNKQLVDLSKHVQGLIMANKTQQVAVVKFDLCDEGHANG